ncbi:MAG TPA: hypothetical protein VGV41_03090 [Pseudolabrys sp.]|jgi:hypothetical protein|uniref:hypothetical protein n=1 Tax=Pseudolabrys sp. TaxID=1960880 RepID=UPI002DDCA666|nr:hypothetical protein [Pseudolabrys sp.]HEV2627614.1 hypothetical protein [Pseudolabrys sp.]
MNADTMRLRIVGERPLLMHSSRLADPLDPAAIDLARVTSKRHKTKADHEEVARLEWYGGLWAVGGVPCLPAEALEASFAKAAALRRKTRQARAGFMVTEPAVVVFAGPTTIDELWADSRFRLRRSVAVGNARTMRTRPMFPVGWSADVTASYLPTLLDRSEVLEIFQIAGAQVGIGDWRPRYGRYKAELID